MSKKRKVQVWIYWSDPKSGKLLYLVLFTRPERGSFWQPVTGSVEPEETLQEAAAREAQEETGLEFTGSPKEIQGGSFEFVSHRQEQIAETSFSLQVTSILGEPPIPVLDPHEHTQYRWLGLEEALQTLKYPSNIRVLELLQSQN